MADLRPSPAARNVGAVPSHLGDTGTDTPSRTANSLPQDRKQAARRQEAQYGGIQAGSAFFGWLTATGTAVLLTALVAAVGAAVGVTTGTSVSDAANQAASGTDTAKTVGIVGGIALLIVLFVAYYCGGYVAGRMTRFNGLRQGLAVWVWAVLIAVLVALVVLVVLVALVAAVARGQVRRTQPAQQLPPHPGPPR
jgi:TRAP-type C4-dicarboxylate transport system permease small subunit